MGLTGKGESWPLCVEIRLVFLICLHERRICPKVAKKGSPQKGQDNYSLLPVTRFKGCFPSLQCACLRGLPSVLRVGSYSITKVKSSCPVPSGSGQSLETSDLSSPYHSPLISLPLGLLSSKSYRPSSINICLDTDCLPGDPALQTAVTVFRQAPTLGPCVLLATALAEIRMRPLRCKPDANKIKLCLCSDPCPSE